ncbi:MAG: hypothetical protein H0W90_11445 [Actinobacteria bacterium]|nr:hypothetical protein [Actinomycetota bacterium]
MRGKPVLIGLMLVAGVAATLAHADTSARVDRIRGATGLRAPVYVTAPSGESNRLYIVEQRGVILAQDATADEEFSWTSADSY